MPENPTREPAVRAFCSYVHKDDESFAGAIQQIIKDICSFHEAETGRAIKIFFDRSDIGWGQDLRSAISDSVENATFFIPMVTARYFQSAWSREELLSFYGKCRALGVTELILPIVLAGLPQISTENDDEVIRIIAQVRYLDWTEIWQSGRGSPAWNTGITHLVQRLVAFQDKVEEHLAHELAAPGPDPDEQPASGASGPEPWPSWQLDRVHEDGADLLGEVEQVVSELRGLFTSLNEDLNEVEIADFHSMSGTLNRLGRRYVNRGHAIVKRARATLEELVDYDAKVRKMIRTSRSMTAKGQAIPLSKQVNDLRNSALRLGDSIRAVDAMSEVLDRYSDVSVGLRVALAPARAGLQTIRDIARILEGWVSMEA